MADRRQLILPSQEPLPLRTRVAGVFLFLPLLAEMGFDALVRKAHYPGTEMVPADAALLNLLALKLLRKERRSHNRVLREASLDDQRRRIPWLNGYRIEIDYRCRDRRA